MIALEMLQYILGQVMHIDGAEFGAAVVVTSWWRQIESSRKATSSSCRCWCSFGCYKRHEQCSTSVGTNYQTRSHYSLVVGMSERDAGTHKIDKEQ
jgi:hypothetical protein